VRAICFLTLSLLMAAVSPGIQAQQAGAAGWITLLDGTTLKGWNTTGDANWKVVDGTVEASSGTGMLVTPVSYANFELTVEFWVDGPANSGVFIRCSDPATITQNNAYEVNIYDTSPDQTYATGSIVEAASASTPMKAAGKWNTFEIRAEGNHLTVSMNGTRTVDVRNDKYSRGPIALQYAAGVVKFRSVKIRTL